MFQGTTVAVVVPAYNESGFVGTVIRTMPTFVDRIYVVDDGSTDGTWDEIRRHASTVAGRVATATTDGGSSPTDDPPVADPASTDDTTESPLTDSRVVAIRHADNRGVGGAIKTGYHRAAADGVDVVAVMGGDGQMDPDVLDRIVAPVADGRADYAKGNRLLDPEYHDEMPRHRLVGNWILTLLTRFASGYWGVGDPQNGFTAISRSAIAAADVGAMYEYYGYCNDLLVKLNVAGARVADVRAPITYADEDSHIRYSSYVPRVSSMLLRNFLWRLRVNHLGVPPDPLAVCYLAGMAAGLGAVVSLGATLAGLASVGTTIALLVGAVLFVVVGAVLDRRRHADRSVTL